MMDATFLDLKLEHAFDVRVDFTADRRLFAPLPGGDRQGYTPVAGGALLGPRLKGRVMPHSGADYARFRADDVIELNAHYLWEADDGTLIYIYNRGYIRVGGHDREKAKVNDQGMAQPLYFRVTPTFRAPVGPHEWLNSTVFVGAAERRQNPDHTLFRYYAVV
jgi:hypothetical protein